MRRNRSGFGGVRLARELHLGNGAGLIAMGLLRRRLASRVVVAAMAGICVLGVTACSGSSHGASHDHGLVVAELPIPLASPATPVVKVAVTVGQRFSVKVDTSDGPYAWGQIGQLPDRQLVRVAGNFDDGHCDQKAVGCRVPYFHTLQAKAPGTTTMTWQFHDFNCQDDLGSNPDCTNNTVTFEITVS
jgi:hypothetical protein